MQEKPENTRIWRQVEKTDPKDIKMIEFGAMQGKRSVNAQARFRMATEVFGPAGIGWGFDIIEDKMVETRPIYNAEAQVVGHEVIHTLKVKLWYRDPATGERGEVVEYGHTPFIYAGKKGTVVDAEYGKKTLTDAIGKCLSILGFNSDIYEGLYDMPGYSQAIAEEFEHQHEAEAVKVAMEKKEAYRKAFESNIRCIETAQTKHEVEKIYRLTLVDVRRDGTEDDNKHLAKVVKAKLKEFEEKNDETV